MHGDHEILSENLLTGIADPPEEKLIQKLWMALISTGKYWKSSRRNEKKMNTLHLQILGHVVCMWSVVHFTCEDL